MIHFVCSRPNHERARLESVACQSFPFLQGQRANWRHQLSSYTYKAALLDKSNYQWVHVWASSAHNPYMEIFKILDNLWKTLHTDISNGVPWLLVFIWPYNGLETHRGNQTLYWSSQIIFWLWRCDFNIFHTTKFKQYVQGEVLLTVLILTVFPNIATTKSFHVHRCEITKCELFIP